jgi:tetratricopeptide (TPR) repeat protein
MRDRTTRRLPPLLAETVPHADVARADRTRLLDEANHARARGRHRRAISLLRLVLERDPADHDVAIRLAELLAIEGQRFEAWGLYRSAGKTALRERKPLQSLAIFREATRCLPFEFEAWRVTAELLRKLGRDEDAQLALREARRQYRSRFDRAQAIEVLRMIRQIDPWDHDIVLDLSRLYAQTDQGARALRILESLAVRTEGPRLRAIRFAQWQISHSFFHLRLWLRLALKALWPETQRGRRSDAELTDPVRAR